VNGDDRDRETHGGPIDWFTVPGRLLFILTNVACAGAFVVYFLAIADDLAPGSYPVLLFVLPVLLAGFFFFLIAAWVLERLGIPMYRRKD
jgi:hypothetical protein